MTDMLSCCMTYLSISGEWRMKGWLIFGWYWLISAEPGPKEGSRLATQKGSKSSGSMIKP